MLHLSHVIVAALLLSPAIYKNHRSQMQTASENIQLNDNAEILIIRMCFLISFFTLFNRPPIAVIK